MSEGLDAGMAAAIAEARAGALEGEIPIGAVVLDPDGRIVARAHNQRESRSDPTAHAEVLALRDAAQALGSGAWRTAPLWSPSSRAPCAPVPS